MLTKVEVLNYRALRYINQALSPFQVLIGPNASGKSTFLDVIAFIGDIVTQPSIADAVRKRAPDIRDLTWMGTSDWLEFAVEAEIPSNIRTQYTRLRYEVRVGVDEETDEIALLTETLWFMSSNSNEANGNYQTLGLFPKSNNPPVRLTSEPNKRTPAGWRKIVSKAGKGNDYFRSETTDWNNIFRLGPKRSALANLPEDETRFAASTWFKRYISEGIQRIMLNSEALRRPSPPQSPRTFMPDGSNLPWVVYELEQNNETRLKEWIAHIRTALPDIRGIHTVERPEDRHRYLVVEYNTQLQAPSWTVSDGTLRMLALTILAYLPIIEGVYLIEEPENGIYPRAVETVFQSLSSVYDAQILLATHSPVVLSLAEPQQLLCFARTENGETDIISGDKHPKLASWRGEVTLSDLYASGVLG
uniref:ATP-binding protein n=1 Tax=Oscillatoriales cyanobacterium SpSt-402 TaxID=2282168 RepID=A0A832M1Y1_9CYAN